MALRTLRFGAFFSETVWIGCDWEDTTGDVMALRVINGGTTPVVVIFAGTGTGPAGRTRTGTFGAGTTVINIPGGQRPRLPVVTSPTGEPELSDYRVTVY